MRMRIKMKTRKASADYMLAVSEETYTELEQTSEAESFVITVNGYKPLTINTMLSIFGICRGP